MFPGHASIPLLTSVAKSPTGKTDCRPLHPPYSLMITGRKRSSMWTWITTNIGSRFNKKLKKGETLAFSIIGSVISSEHSPDPWNEAERLNIYAYLEGTERLLMRHQSAWDEIWESDIRIEGDLEGPKRCQGGPLSPLLICQGWYFL